MLVRSCLYVTADVTSSLRLFQLYSAYVECPRLWIVTIMWRQSHRQHGMQHPLQCMVRSDCSYVLDED